MSDIKKEKNVSSSLNPAILNKPDRGPLSVSSRRIEKRKRRVKHHTLRPQHSLRNANQRLQTKTNPALHVIENSSNVVNHYTAAAVINDDNTADNINTFPINNVSNQIPIHYKTVGQHSESPDSLVPDDVNIRQSHSNGNGFYDASGEGQAAAAVNNENISDLFDNLKTSLLPHQYQGSSEYQQDTRDHEDNLSDLFDSLNKPLETEQYNTTAEDSPDISDQEETQEIIPIEMPGNKDILVQCHKALRLVVRWDRMLSFLCLTGSVRFTAKQYGILAAAIKTVSNGVERLRSFKAVRSSQWKFILNNLFPKSSIVYISKNHRRQFRAHIKARVKTKLYGEQDPRDCVRLVQPSEWAKVDVLTLPIYESIFGDISNSGLNIENSPLVFSAVAVVYGQDIVVLSFQQILTTSWKFSVPKQSMWKLEVLLRMMGGFQP